MRALAWVLTFVVAIASPAARTAAWGPHDLSFTAIEGGPLPLSRYAGKALLVVNTASMCGYTYQYAGLQALWQRYRARGLVVLGVPSDDFSQEPGANDAIKTFCEVNFAVDFPMTEKVHVTGARSHPLFAWFRRELGPEAGPRWNFHKYLVGPDGRLVGAWPSSVEPSSAEVVRAIDDVLPDA